MEFDIPEGSEVQPYIHQDVTIKPLDAGGRLAFAIQYWGWPLKPAFAYVNVSFTTHGPGSSETNYVLHYLFGRKYERPPNSVYTLTNTIYITILLHSLGGYGYRGGWFYFNRNLYKDLETSTRSLAPHYVFTQRIVLGAVGEGAFFFDYIGFYLQPTESALSVEPKAIVKGSAMTVSLRLADVNGVPMTGQVIRFEFSEFHVEGAEVKYGNITYMGSAVTGLDGVASIWWKFDKAGRYIIYAYGGGAYCQDMFYIIGSSSTIHVEDYTPYIGLALLVVAIVEVGAYMLGRRHATRKAK